MRSSARTVSCSVNGLILSVLVGMGEHDELGKQRRRLGYEVRYKINGKLRALGIMDSGVQVVLLWKFWRHETWNQSGWSIIAYRLVIGHQVGLSEQGPST